MIRRIDLFMPPVGQYGVIHHFTKKLQEALTRSGVSCRLLVAQRDNPAPFLSQLLNDPPDCTLSFNGLLPDEEGRFFCDMLRIPHVACLVDSPNQFVPLIHSPYTIITCVDRYACQFFKEMQFDRVLFMPHAVEKNLQLPNHGARPYDVLMLASCIDHEALAATWQVKYSEHICDLLLHAAEKTLNTEGVSYIQNFVQLFNEYITNHRDDNASNYDFIEMLDELETYIRGIDRIRTIKAVKTARVDIFGDSYGNKGWKEYLKDCGSNIALHSKVSFEEALELMKQAKVLLNSCSWIQDGGHERIFSGQACGAVIVAKPNPYLREYYSQGKDILFFNDDSIDQDINSLIADEAKRSSIALAGRSVVMRNHTWDQRAGLLIKGLAPLVKTIREQQGTRQPLP